MRIYRDTTRPEEGRRSSRSYAARRAMQLIAFAVVISSIFISAACGRKAVDPRTVIPADALVYLETADLGKVVDAVTSSPEFQRLAKTKPDHSALNGIRLSVAITGFQTSEETVTEDRSVLDLKPQFVAVAETNAWNYQALRFADEKLGEFVNDIYGGDVELITTDKPGGKYFTWTARDGRKAFALVNGSLIMFGNDESAIDRCVNVLNGQAASIDKNPKMTAFPTDTVAAGYVSPDGVAQIANILGVSLAMDAGEEGEVKSFIARVLPEVVRNTVTDAAWFAKTSDNGRMEDHYSLAISPDTAKVLDETLTPGGDPDQDLARFIPAELNSTTRYNLKDPQIAWRSVLFTARTKTDQLSGSLLTAFSSSLFEPYGVVDAELFLSSVGGNIQTVRFDADGEEVALSARISDLEKLKRSLAKELNTSKAPAKFEGADLWRSEDGELSLAVVEGRVILGENGSVERCLAARASGKTLAAALVDKMRDSNAVAVTSGRDTDPDAKLISTLSERKDAAAPLSQAYTTETRFNRNGIERTTVSDFGLLGALIARMGNEDH